MLGGSTGAVLAGLTSVVALATGAGIPWLWRAVWRACSQVGSSVGWQVQ